LFAGRGGGAGWGGEEARRDDLDLASLDPKSKNENRTRSRQYIFSTPFFSLRLRNRGPFGRLRPEVAKWCYRLFFGRLLLLLLLLVFLSFLIVAGSGRENEVAPSDRRRGYGYTATAKKEMIACGFLVVVCALVVGRGSRASKYRPI